MAIGAKVSALPRLEFPEMPDCALYFALAEATRKITRELEGAAPESRRAIALAEALRHAERSALSLRALAGLAPRDENN